VRKAAVHVVGASGGAVFEWSGGKGPGSVPLDDHCQMRIDGDQELILRSAAWHQELRFRAADGAPSLAEWHGAMLAAQGGLTASPGGRTRLLAPPGGNPENWRRSSASSSATSSKTNLPALQEDGE
jgi:hypothetical protein